MISSGRRRFLVRRDRAWMRLATPSPRVMWWPAQKALADVERLIRTLNGELEVRPIRHRLPDGVRAQVFLRMLSCYLSWYLKQALAPILCHDHDEPAAAAQRRNPVGCGPAFQPRAGQGLPQTHRRPLPRRSFTSLLADLATICANHVSRPRHASVHHDHHPHPLQRWAFELLGVAHRHGLT